jgi:hypothetical protein
MFRYFSQRPYSSSLDMCVCVCLDDLGFFIAMLFPMLSHPYSSYTLTVKVTEIRLLICTYFYRSVGSVSWVFICPTGVHNCRKMRDMKLQKQ